MKLDNIGEVLLAILMIVLIFYGGYWQGHQSKDKCWELWEENGVHSNFDLNGTLVSNYTYHSKQYACNFEPKIINESEFVNVGVNE